MMHPTLFSPALRRFSIFACALGAFTALPAMAFRLEPMVLIVPVTEPRAAGTYTVENTTPSKVAVEFQMKERHLDLEGVETRPAAKGFLVYPPQLKLEPGEKRSVRITWAGDSIPTAEKAYRLVATQLPVNFESDQAAGTNIRFLLEYVASFYLTPKGAKGKLKVADQSVNAKGALEIRVKNDGRAHELLEKMTITVQSGAKKFEPSPEALAELRTGNILAGEERILHLTLPKGFGKEAKARVTFSP